MPSARQIAFQVLRAVARGAFADVALDRELRQQSPTRDRPPTDIARDHRLVAELVYGTIRRQRTLDCLIDHLATKPASQQPPALRLILHLGLYQLTYLSQIPASAAVDTTVELAKANGFEGLAGFVNGLLRRYVRWQETEDRRLEIENREQGTDDREQGTGGRPVVEGVPRLPLALPSEPVERLGIVHSYPDWIIRVWLEQLGEAETERLCQWLNQTPALDLRVNPLRASLAQVTQALADRGITAHPVTLQSGDAAYTLPQALRLSGNVGAIPALPGFAEGWWLVQDSSAQLVSHLLDPQPGETVIDACAAPGGKATHLAELMQDQGVVWACDRYPSRLRKIKQNAQRLGLRSLRLQVGDSRNLPQFTQQADRVLVDAPCSGLGTLHRHADARWRQTPDTVQALVQLQSELLDQAATWVKPGGVLVYATCTLHPAENEDMVTQFLATHPHWRLDPPRLEPISPGESPSPLTPFVDPAGWLKLWPQQTQMDGFFMARMVCG
ncbi:16S rRNA (cytosine(967)-C(5))-methyltransferase [Trichothermofontia sichuanensis B231]|uniref:16S rRNA (cytosine(967)-C(5))-methyltransferase n=1 Tax=Trichothermofontia sichuanensis TaxID=3045816 RepID=UPI0022478841|nr:16S rRNA (cytosine(967)-C(5))-methyltransferase [Trichothermofontia sichuanensis]UZQ53301.1 16S rRNA (cytosine(967)-C(5))-methyltransferase [Trichothermofontia sichuanensis B231]